MKNNKSLNIALLVIGLVGIAITGYFIIYEYNKAKNVGEFLKPAIIGFIPFIASYVLARTGIKKLVTENK